MLNGTDRLTKLGTRNDRRLPFARQGWEDARLGKPINFDILDRAPEAFAVAYELSRYCVITLLAKGIKIPQWKDFHSLPPDVNQMLRQAVMLNVICKRSEEPVFYPTPLQ